MKWLLLWSRSGLSTSFLEGFHWTPEVFGCLGVCSCSSLSLLMFCFIVSLLVHTLLGFCGRGLELICCMQMNKSPDQGLRHRASFPRSHCDGGGGILLPPFLLPVALSHDEVSGFPEQQVLTAHVIREA